MEIYVELIFIFLIVLIFVFWVVWFNITKKRAIKKYKQEDDKGKIGEEHRKELIKRGDADPIAAITDREFSSEGFTESEERGVLQTSETNSVGKDSRSRGKTGTSPRGIFGKFRRNRRSSTTR